MILPIYTYGEPILIQQPKTIDLTKEKDDIQILIRNMFETLHAAKGVGLSAHQVGVPIKLFIVDTSDGLGDDSFFGFKKVFINPVIIERSDNKSTATEGCLSFPNLMEDVSRPEKITIEYLNENFEYEIVDYEGIIARIIQHEYDHVFGTLFIKRFDVKSFKKINKTLTEIQNKKIKTNYLIV
jgi:peptide deformylase